MVYVFIGPENFISKIVIIFLTYVLGVQKSGLIETVLFGTRN